MSFFYWDDKNVCTVKDGTLLHEIDNDSKRTYNETPEWCLRRCLKDPHTVSGPTHQL